ncbi:MAG: DUF502 domain-containing protein [Bdellovibrionales bacterium]
MKHIMSTFFKGLFTLLPLLLSLYLVLWFITWVERFSRSTLLVFWPDFLYLPGLGLLVAFLLIYAFGSVVDRPLARGVFNIVEGLFRETPIIKTVYLAIKDFTEYLKPGKGRTNNQVVLVRFPNSETEIMGLLTRENLRDLPDAVTKEERVAVYIPMSYQLGGVTIFIPRAWIKPTDMGVEAAMRAIITAWLPGQDKKLEKNV